jgi:hypothetical protein
VLDMALCYGPSIDGSAEGRFWYKLCLTTQVGVVYILPCVSLQLLFTFVSSDG